MNAFAKFILWCVCSIAISGITILVLYKLAYFIAICVMLLLAGAVIGIPTLMVIKHYWKKETRNINSEEYEEFLKQFRRKE